MRQRTSLSAPAQGYGCRFCYVQRWRKPDFRIRKLGKPIMWRLFLCAFSILAVSSAHAAGCNENFTMQGVPMVTALEYKSFAIFPKRSTKDAVQRLAGAVLADGYSDMKVDEKYGAISALQETSGSGRPQTLRLVARKTGAGTRVDGVFTIQQGQLTSDAAAREGLCRLIESAGQ